MNKNYSQKGFTLIEMLIVVAIIAILASVFLVGLTGYRSSAYDSRRLSDLQQVQSYLELYYNVNRNYPPGNSTSTINSWVDLKSALINAGIGVTTLPSDPAGLSYYYQSCASGQGYLLATPMTSTSKSLSNSAANPAVACTGMDLPVACGAAISGTSNSLYCVVQQ